MQYKVPYSSTGKRHVVSFWVKTVLLAVPTAAVLLFVAVNGVTWVSSWGTAGILLVVAMLTITFIVSGSLWVKTCHTRVKQSSNPLQWSPEGLQEFRRLLMEQHGLSQMPDLVFALTEYEHRRVQIKYSSLRPWRVPRHWVASDRNRLSFLNPYYWEGKLNHQQRLAESKDPWGLPNLNRALPKQDWAFLTYDEGDWTLSDQFATLPYAEQ